MRWPPLLEDAIRLIRGKETMQRWSVDKKESELNKTAIREQQTSLRPMK
jgi:hypothetical protein